MFLDKLYTKSYPDFLQEIIEKYTEKGSVVVNFLYFANIMKWRLLEDFQGLESDKKENAKLYETALLNSDYLLTDGIALQVFEKVRSGVWLDNLNGTDLIPRLLEDLGEKYAVSVYLYQCYDPSIGKEESSLETALDALQTKFPSASIPWSGQCLYQERGEGFDRDGLADISTKDPSEIKIFFNCTGTPFQESWVDKHAEFFQEHGFLVLNAGGAIDFITGYEKRAPDWVVKSRIGETFWRIATNPKKNLGKFLVMFGILRYWLFLMKRKS